MKSACCPLSRGIDASVARGYAKQLSWNAVSCSETRVDVMRLTRARILAGSYARALRLRDSTKLHTLLSHPMNLFFFLSFSPSFSRCSSFRLVPFRLISSRLPYRWNTTGQLIRETRGVSRIASVFRLRNASRDTPRPWEFYTCRNYTGCELVRCKQTTSVRLSRQPRRHRSFSATIHVDTTPR